ncbi:NADH dehydrogenase (ubiquinone), 30 kDa subunit [Syntrophobotulus glycolicus DSM 8271]|uniref:NADH dehydrogenase (Ubiquinone), 30 kDa subunit n=1 Tax=Syntrophobotulus glycolicus (strain DSM 8271 / FlGlyR) TaxID=645991 RepID=F0T206_SYNGF|nr:NADH-quinone oxidoreductase subunit C [Syntrophobotulus glycolicus]ADY56350.1 NADH dehydrogenase (ubiquinone), 30 kDa subunit [Syntrophobotulus glycolicus DSM 8271]
MIEVQNYLPVTASEIENRTKQYAKEGFRLIQMCCTKSATEMDIIYTFEKENYQMINLKMPVEVGDTIPSVSGIFLHAFLYENEIHDLYGVNVAGMAVDFKGTLYQTAVKHPFVIPPDSSKK